MARIETTPLFLIQPLGFDMHSARLLPLLLAILLTPSTLYATDLVAEKELLTQGPVAVGDTVQYLITVRNDKISFAIDTGVQLFERYTPGLEWIDIQGDFSILDCMPVVNTDGFDCTFDIAAQEVKVAVVTFIAREVGVQGNAFSVNPTVGEIDPSDNESPTVTIVVTGNLLFTKRGEAIGSGFIPTGTSDISAGAYGYEIKVSSSLGLTSQDLTITDVLPEQLQASSLGSLFPPVLTVGGSRIHCDFGGTPLAVSCPTFDLPPGEEATLVVLFEAKPMALLPEVCNTAILFEDGEELDRATTCAPVVKRYVSRDEAIQATAGQANPTATVRTSAEPIPAGSQVCDAGGDACMDIDEPTWVSLVDPYPSALYGHETIWVTVPAGSDQEATPPATTYPGGPLPPVINISDENGGTTTTSTADLPVVIDPRPAIEVFPDVEADNSTPPPMARVCALLVTGYYQNETERQGFMATRTVMQRYLTAQPRGPRLPTQSVETLDNPTAEELEKKLEELQGICDVLYFYYYGHGDASGLFLKSDNNPSKFKRLSYPMLAEDIYSVGAVENIVVLDNCNAGAAIPGFKSDPNYERRSLTLLTGASAENLGYQVFRTSTPGVLLSFYTGGLAICANDNRADTNGDSKVSLKEAHAWLRRVNPRLHRVRNQQGGVDRFGINESQDPQLLDNQVQQNNGQAIFEFEGSDVTVTVGGGKRGGTAAIDAIRVEEVIPREGAEPDDPALIELADGRQRTVEVLETGTTGFNIDIAFGMDPSLDSLTTTGLPGLAFRTDDTGTWMPQARTVWNPEDSTVTVTGITTSGDWAFALTSGASAVAVEDASLPRTFMLHGNHPNPAASATTLTFDLAETAEVHVAVFDLLGREVLALTPRRMEAGAERALSLEASALPPGVYLYRLTARSNTRTDTTTGRFVLVQ